MNARLQARRRLAVTVGLGILIAVVILAARGYYQRPIDDYRFHTPPPGPNARPDPPNPDKIKHLPRALTITK